VIWDLIYTNFMNKDEFHELKLEFGCSMPDLEFLSQRITRLRIYFAFVGVITMGVRKKFIITKTPRKKHRSTTKPSGCARHNVCSFAH